MSIGDVASAEANGMADLPTIALFLDADEKARYLHEENELLAAHCPNRKAPYRIGIWAEKLLGSYLYPRDTTSMIALMRQYDKSPSQFDKFVDSLEFDGLVQGILVDAIAEGLLERGFFRLSPTGLTHDQALSLVYSITLSDQLTEPGSSLQNALCPDFVPNAIIFKAGPSTEHRTVRIWQSADPSSIGQKDWPICRTCNQKARPAGPVFVCESCGAAFSPDGRVVPPKD